VFVTLCFRVIPQSKEDYEEVSKLMRLYGSAVRYAHNRFLENRSKKMSLSPQTNTG
jgi:predicted transposase